MLTQSTRVYLPLSVVAMVLSIFYVVWTGDFTGTVLLLITSLVAAYAAIVVTGARENEVAVMVPADAPPPQSHPVQPAPLLAGGGIPLAAATATALVLLGLVIGPFFYMAGLVIGAVTAVAWLSRVTADHSGREVNLLPLSIPVMSFFFIASLIFLMSRILLAVTEQAATWIALAVAVAIMGAASVASLRPNISSRALAAVLGVAGVLMIAGGLGAAAIGEREMHSLHHEEAVEVDAINVAFDKKELHLHADKPSTVDFINSEAKGTYHNIAIYSDPEFSKVIYSGEVIDGGDEVVYHIDPLPAGMLHFRCDIHPTVMTGTVVVE